MTKKLKYIEECPCCKMVVDERELQQTIGRTIKGLRCNWKISEKYILRELEDFQNWACDDCLIKGKAIKSNNPQNFGYSKPYFAYYDKTIVCESCKDEFIFSKEEQQYWFETLQFRVDAKCLNCKSCRKTIRKARKLNTELSNILKDKSKMSETDFDRVIEIYNLMDKAEKVSEWKTYRTRFLKKLRLYGQIRGKA